MSSFKLKGEGEERSKREEDVQRMRKKEMRRAPDFSAQRVPKGRKQLGRRKSAKKG